jgi:hypothetical protein
MKPLVVFTHTPRTGGTSLWALLRKVYRRRCMRVSGGKWFGVHIVPEILRLAREESDSYDLIGGSISPQMPVESDRPVRRVLSLRNPADVVLSKFYKNLRPEVRERKRKRGVVLPVPPPDLEPIQAIEFWQSEISTSIYSFLCNDASRILMDPCESADIDRAKTLVADEIDGFTILEHMPESLELLAHVLDWEAVPEFGHKNAGPNRPARPDETLYRRARELLTFDFELYDFAVELQRERLAAIT